MVYPTKPSMIYGHEHDYRTLIQKQGVGHGNCYNPKLEDSDIFISPNICTFDLYKLYVLGC